MDEPAINQRVSNVISDNLALKDQLKETVKDVNRLEKQNFKAKNTIADLKSKIEKMRKRHAQALKLACESPVTPIENDEKRMKISKMDNQSDEGSFYQDVRQLPSLKCSEIEG